MLFCEISLETSRFLGAPALGMGFAKCNREFTEMLDYKKAYTGKLKTTMKTKTRKTTKAESTRKTIVKARQGQGMKASTPEAPEPAPGTPARKPVCAPTLASDADMAAPAPAKPGQIILQLIRPGAANVFVAGSFNGWQPDTIKLQSLGDGRWTGSVEPGAGRHEYLFVVDGNWIPDPDARESAANPFGGTNSVLIV